MDPKHMPMLLFIEDLVSHLMNRLLWKFTSYKSVNVAPRTGKFRGSVHNAFTYDIRRAVDLIYDRLSRIIESRFTELESNRKIHYRGLKDCAEDMWNTYLDDNDNAITFLRYCVFVIGLAEKFYRKGYKESVDFAYGIILNHFPRGSESALTWDMLERAARLYVKEKIEESTSTSMDRWNSGSESVDDENLCMDSGAIIHGFCGCFKLKVPGENFTDVYKMREHMLKTHIYRCLMWDRNVTGRDESGSGIGRGSDEDVDESEEISRNKRYLPQYQREMSRLLEMIEAQPPPHSTGAISKHPVKADVPIKMELGSSSNEVRNTWHTPRKISEFQEADERLLRNFDSFYGNDKRPRDNEAMETERSRQATNNLSLADTQLRNRSGDFLTTTKTDKFILDNMQFPQLWVTPEDLGVNENTNNPIDLSLPSNSGEYRSVRESMIDFQVKTFFNNRASPLENIFAKAFLDIKNCAVSTNMTDASVFEKLNNTVENASFPSTSFSEFQGPPLSANTESKELLSVEAVLESALRNLSVGDSDPPKAESSEMLKDSKLFRWKNMSPLANLGTEEISYLEPKSSPAVKESQDFNLFSAENKTSIAKSPSLECSEVKMAQDQTSDKTEDLSLSTLKAVSAQHGISEDCGKLLTHEHSTQESFNHSEDPQKMAQDQTSDEAEDLSLSTLKGASAQQGISGDCEKLFEPEFATEKSSNNFDEKNLPSNIGSPAQVKAFDSEVEKSPPTLKSCSSLGSLDCSELHWTDSSDDGPTLEETFR